MTIGELGNLGSSLGKLNESVLQIRKNQSEIANLTVLTENVSSIGSSIAELAGNVDLLKAYLYGELSVSQSGLHNAGNQLNRVSTRSRGNTFRITDLESSLDDLNETILQLIEQQGNITHNLSELVVNLSLAKVRLGSQANDLKQDSQIGLNSIREEIAIVNGRINSLNGSAKGLAEGVHLLRLDRDRALSDLAALERRVDDLVQARKKDRMQMLLAFLTMGVALAVLELFLAVRFRRVR